MQKLQRRTLLLLGTVAVALATGVGYAAIPSSSGAVNGCYERITGILRVIDKEAGKSCKSFETAITWSVQGPTGAPGAIGPKGETGAKGEKGDPGTPAPNYSAGMGLELAGTEFRLGFDPATQTELDAANAARTALQQQVNQLSAQSQTQASQIAALQTTVSSQAGRLATVEAQLAHLSGALTVTSSGVFLNRDLFVDGEITADSILLP